MNDFTFLLFTTQKYSSFNPPYFPKRTLKFFLNSIPACSALGFAGDSDCCYDAEKGYTAVPQPYFAMATLIFPIISFFGTSIYWWRHEKQKTISCLFLLLQLYPAFSQCRLLILLYTKNPTWAAERDQHEQKLSLIGM